ncbi:MarP family serine protease [Tersicoccus sp. Bi-70]|uniref:MarP family serine protease n=1 Tax=Tersicoccus sp. Bi-70 TaxID=1897634 RepID=UPI0009788533|nr:MarP family serine protease [Tersicoccus sp. Bi-70]OMH34422.1 colicin V production protein [Tersicoccus sp. Bi-70]
MPISLLDVVLLLVLIGYLVHGFRVGFLVSIGGLAGFALGAVAAFFAVPLVSQWVTDSAWRTPAAIAVIIVLLVIGSSLGSRFGAVIRRAVGRIGPIRALDRGLGAAVNVIVCSLVLSLLSFAVSTMGVPMLSRAIAGSAVLQTVDRLTPPPLAASMARVRAGLFANGGIPRILAENLQSTPVPVPDESTDTPALRAAAGSVVRITGNAYQCGQNQTGSGWVMAPGRVVTNAHVVAGVGQPVVEVPNQNALPADVVLFDPVKDIAVLAVDGLGTAALEAGNPLAGGDSAVVAGYPLGGPYQAKPAGVQSRGSVRIPDIYGTGTSSREVYQLSADVQQGNSGGPLLDTRGRVVGMVFAKSRENVPVGYALTLAQVRSVVDGAGTSEVSTGACIRG